MRRVQVISVLVAATLGAGGLAACSSGDFEVQSAAPQSAGPNLDKERIGEVLTDIQATLKTADEKQDKEALKQRLAEPALSMRSKQYDVAAKTGGAVPALDLTAQSLTVTINDEFPRVILDATVQPEGALPKLAVITQKDARSDYQLENYATMLGGTELTTAAVEKGTPYIAPDGGGYVMTPKDAVQGYVDMLNAGETGNDRYAADEFANTYKGDLTKLNESVTAAGEVGAHAEVSPDYPITTVALADGRALVSTAIKYSHTYKRTVARSTMKLGGTPAVMSDGNESVTGTVTVHYLTSIMLAVPKEGSSEKTSLIGAERVIFDLTRDDGAKPAGEE